MTLWGDEMADNVVTALLRIDGVPTTTRPLYQYDYGQILQLTGHELPPAYEVHFANAGDSTSKTQIGGADGVSIPDEYLESGAAIHAWLFLHAGPNDGETKAMIIIPVRTKIKTGDEEPVPVEQSVITQAIAALNAGVSQVEDIAEGIPQAIADALTEAKDSGEFDGPPGKDGKDGQDGKDGTDGYTPVKGVDYFDGQDGAPGKDGKDGQDGQPGRDGEDGEPGQDGVSPSITVTDITGGHRVTITDAEGAHSIDVMDGDNGVGVPSGGTTGQVLTKASGTDYDTEWTTPEAGGVTDVQVNGTSVVSGGVANIVKATDAQVKAGTETGKILVPSLQDASTFFGLAKAAGDTTQSVSNNAVGVYTETAKSKITSMIEPKFRLIKEIAITEETGTIHITTDSNGGSFTLNEIVVSFSGVKATGTGNTGISVNNGNVATGTNAPYLSISNLHNTTAQTRTASLWVKGGKLFGECMGLSASNHYTAIAMATSINASGIIDCANITEICIDSLNAYKFTEGTIKVYGR